MTAPVALVFAHPDDETFAMGGTCARLATDRVPLTLYCATPGDAGRSSGIPVASKAELGALRARELDAAARILGVGTVEHGRWHDGQLPQADPDQLVGDVVRFLRRHRPDVVVTFGPEGAPTGHRDHRAISRAATAAFFLAGLPSAYPEQREGGDPVAPHRPSRLYYVAWHLPGEGHERLSMESVPPTLAVDTTATHDAELAAFLAHATQRDHEAAFRAMCLTPTEMYALVSTTDAAAPDPLATLGTPLPPTP